MMTPSVARLASVVTHSDNHEAILYKFPGQINNFDKCEEPRQPGLRLLPKDEK